MKTNKLMKISLPGLMIILTVFITQAQNIAITGKLQPGKYEGLALISAEKNVNIPVWLSADNSFRITAPTIIKGYYMLGSLNLYLESGFNLQIIPEGQTYTFSGRGGAENNALIKTEDAKMKCFHLKPDGGVYYSSLNISPDSLLRKIDTYMGLVNTNAAAVTNPYFKNLLLSDVNSYCRNMIFFFKQNYALDSTVVEELDGLGASKYYTDQMDMYKMMMIYAYTINQDWLTDAQKARLDREISKDFEWNNEPLYLNSSSYRSELITQIEQIKGPKGTSKAKTDPEYYTDQMRVVDEKVTNSVIKDGLKGTLGINYLKMEKNEQRMDSMYKVLASLKIAGYTKGVIESQYKNARVLKADPASINFAYQDVNGKIVQLKDLRGKYVYIDIWATWCTPCKAEIPYLMKIEEEYKNKNIEFVSLSVDKKADKGKWMQMVKDLQLTGIQVIADKDFSSDFIQVFQIASIPRFILIASDGKIVSADAFRPSDPKLREQLDKLL